MQVTLIPEESTLAQCDGFKQQHPMEALVTHRPVDLM